MNIPPKYEDLVFQLNELNKREAALREELAVSNSAHEVAAQNHGALNAEIFALQQRLTVAEQRADELEGLLRGALRHVPHYGKSDWQGSLRHQINEALKPAAEGEGS